MNIMGITKDTTDDELLASVRLDKTALHIATSTDNIDRKDSEDLAGLVNAIANQEGRLQARYELRNMLQYAASPDAMRRNFLRFLLMSPDDTYSGRRNDARRAKREGLVDEIGRLLGKIDEMERNLL